MAIALRYAARSDIGLGRYKNNQDSGYAGPHLLVVADGMGGHAGGDVASSIAVGELSSLDGESLGPEASRHLERGISRARDTIKRRTGDEPELSGMGTTVTAILRSGRKLVLAHIGDSRAYLLHEGRLTQVTKDHTFVQTLIDEGRITPEEAERHPQRSMIMRVVGDVDAAGSDVDTSVREASVGDRWLLCSDGLSGVVSHDTLEETLLEVSDPGECADQLISLALKAGGPDNITCIVADVVEVASVPDSTPQVVGAAAAAGRRGTVAADTPAARAAALVRDAEDEDEADEDGGPSRWRLVRRTLAVVVLAALLVGGGWAAYAWSQQQYYVGTATADAGANAGQNGSQDGGQNVAIYRGLTQDVGPIRLSGLYEEQELPVDTLPQVWQQRVASGITAESLNDARRIVRDLRQRSDLCDPVPVAPAPTATSAPTATPSPTTASPAPTAGAPAPSPTTPAPSPSPSLTVPPGCEEAG